MLQKNRSNGSGLGTTPRRTATDGWRCPRTASPSAECGEAEDAKQISRLAILRLEEIGIHVQNRSGKYRITDIIVGLKVPNKPSSGKARITKMKDKIRKKLKSLDRKYLALVDLSYSDASTKSKKNSDAREFEIQTADLFTKALCFGGMRLGDLNRPGAIIDNKFL